MAKKIPVGAAIAHAYGFSIRRYGHLLKLTWPLMLAIAALNALVTPQVSVISQGIVTRDFSGLTMPGYAVLALYLAFILLTAMWMTGIYQVALDRPEAQQRPVYFSLARPMWRVIGAFLLMLLSLVGVLIAYAIAVAIILYLFRLGLGLAHVPDTALVGIAKFDLGIALLVGQCGFLLCALRFGFLLLPVTLAEDRIGLFRSWTLSHGNFWRMFWILLAVLLPLIIVESAGFFWLGLFPHMQAGMSQAQMQAAQHAASAAASAKMQHYWYLIYPGGVIIGLWVNALLAGAQTHAYRALRQDGP